MQHDEARARAEHPREKRNEACALYGLSLDTRTSCGAQGEHETDTEGEREQGAEGGDLQNAQGAERDLEQ